MKMNVATLLGRTVGRGCLVQYRCLHSRDKCTSIPMVEYNFEYLCNSANLESIQENISRRKGVGDIFQVQMLHKELQNAKLSNKSDIWRYEENLNVAASKIPNATHPTVLTYANGQPKLLKYIGTDQRERHDFQPLEFSQICKHLNVLRTEHLGNFTGHKSYYLYGELCELEQALIRFVCHELTRRGFAFVSVPDILPRHVIEKCGLATGGDRTQVYSLDKRHGADQCLSGTAEMALAAHLMNSRFLRKDLPLKLAALSRCYRAETSSVSEERGIYRVHQFTKIEMFAVSVPTESDEMLEYLREVEEGQFGALGLHLRTLDMPPDELGAPAYRKYDIEVWLPGRQLFGEISSCSNCTDYQSRRLNIMYQNSEGAPLDYVHTLNGTACAIPRMLIAILETCQQKDGSIRVPEVLQPFLKDKPYLTRQKHVPHLKLNK